MIFDMGKVVSLAVLAFALHPLQAMADGCGDRVTQLEAGNKSLTLKQRTHVTKEFDAFYLESHAPSARIMVSCGPKILSFDTEWSGGSLSNYSGLLSQVSQSLDLGSDDFASSLQKCWSRAAVEDDDEDGTVIIPTSRAQISCVDKDGNAQITVTRAQD
jgi:hypothetical protein